MMKYETVTPLIQQLIRNFGSHCIPIEIRFFPTETHYVLHLHLLFWPHPVSTKRTLKHHKLQSFRYQKLKTLLTSLVQGRLANPHKGEQ